MRGVLWNEQRKQWEDLDTTPGTWYEAESSRAGPLEWLSDLWGRLSFEFSKFRWGQSKIRQYAIWALIPLLALLVFQIVYRSRKKLRRNARSNAEELDFNWQGLDSELYELEKKLSGRWADRAPSEPLAEWFARMSEDPALAGQVPRITEVLNLHYRYRFDPAGLTAAERVSLRSGVQACLAAMA